MNPRSRTSRRCLALLLASALVAGCGGDDEGATSASSSPAGGDSHRGGTMTILWSSTGSSIDTAVDYDQFWQILTMTNDGLVGWKKVAGPEGNTLVPDLAEEIPEPTDGGRTYTFTLRPDIRYSTGDVVKASDFRHTIERQFTIPGPVPQFYSGLVGGDQCVEAGKSCDLSEGIVTDDAARTITFNLTEPDPNFLQKLAVPFAYVVPEGTPDRDIGTDPLPATGPYMIESYVPDQEMVFVRNPHFKEWSKDAQPDGYADRIVMKIGLTSEESVTQIQNGDADWMYDQPPADRLEELGSQYADQVHVNPVPQVYHMALNTRVPPFDRVEVRQALNYATDRNAIITIWGGPSLAEPSCQILPPNFPGYEPYCPYTKDPGTEWTAPDMERAQELVDASGTKGQKVTVIITPDETSKAVGLYFVSVLRDLGYDADTKTLSAAVEYPYVQDSRNKAQISFSYWYPDYPAASNFLDIVVGCKGFRPASTASPNLSAFCDQDIEAKTNEALSLEATDREAANVLWTEVDRETTDAAPWVTLFVAKRLDFVSARLGNFQFNPSVVGNFMISQAWVQ